MKNKGQPAIKATELELLLRFEIALAFITCGFYMECFCVEKQKVKDHIDFIAKGWQLMVHWLNPVQRLFL